MAVNSPCGDARRPPVVAVRHVVCAVSPSERVVRARSCVLGGVRSSIGDRHLPLRAACRLVGLSAMRPGSGRAEHDGAHSPSMDRGVHLDGPITGRDASVRATLQSRQPPGGAPVTRPYRAKMLRCPGDDERLLAERVVVSGWCTGVLGGGCECWYGASATYQSPLVTAYSCKSKDAVCSADGRPAVWMGEREWGQAPSTAYPLGAAPPPVRRAGYASRAAPQRAGGGLHPRKRSWRAVGGLEVVPCRRAAQRRFRRARAGRLEYWRALAPAASRGSPTY